MLLGFTLNSGWVLASFCPGASARPRACPASEHGHPQLCSASAPGIRGSHRVGGLRLGSPGGCSVPRTPDGRLLALSDFCPHGGGPWEGAGGEAEKGDGSAPAQPPCPWAATGGGREPRLGGVPAAQQECNQSRWCR